ncbi:MAG TPA: hypothetical protein VK753_01155 [Xanthomonadaceae bacterium]|jgi:hypothetical protein|nr:hypothetical protein [Xanthomonadaceae bacterium]
MYKQSKIDSRSLLAFTVVVVATALSMSSPAFAADPPAAATSAPQPNAACTGAEKEPMTGTHIRRDCDATTLDTVTVYGGADLRPGDAQWADDDKSAPELPMTRDPGTVKR